MNVREYVNAVLQTVVDVAAEKNSTLVMPFPVELLRFFNRFSDPDARSASAGSPAGEPMDDGAVR